MERLKDEQERCCQGYRLQVTDGRLGIGYKEIIITFNLDALGRHKDWNKYEHEHEDP